MSTSLLTKSDLSKIPKLYETEEIEIADKTVHVKLFTPWSNWTWYVIECDGVDRCFGFVKGHEAEFGYFSLKDLASIEGPFGLRVERDRFFTPTQVGDIPRWYLVVLSKT